MSREKKAWEQILHQKEAFWDELFVGFSAFGSEGIGSYGANEVDGNGMG